MDHSSLVAKHKHLPQQNTNVRDWIKNTSVNITFFRMCSREASEPHQAFEECCIHLSKATEHRSLSPASLKQRGATSALSRMMNESQQITHSLTIMLTWRRQIARLKRTGVFMREWQRRRQDLGVPFQFSCHLSTPTHPPPSVSTVNLGWRDEHKEDFHSHILCTVRKLLEAIRREGAATLLLW